MLSAPRIHLHIGCSLNRERPHFIRGEKLLSDLSTWGIGGPCKYFVQVSDQHQLAAAVRQCSEQSMRYIVIGKSSNFLFDDLGFDGCVIQNSIVFVDKIRAGLYRAGSGYPVNRLGVQTAMRDSRGLNSPQGFLGPSAPPPTWMPEQMGRFETRPNFPSNFLQLLYLKQLA